MSESESSACQASDFFSQRLTESFAGHFASFVTSLEYACESGSCVSSKQIVRVSSGRSSTTSDFAASVRASLSLPVPMVSSMFLYDEVGTRHFENITKLEEYYLTQLEHNILREFGSEISSLDVVNVIEFGAGDGHKTQTLLDSFASVGKTMRYFPIDISESAIHSLVNGFETSTVCAIVANNIEGCEFAMRVTSGASLALFLGSSIGNYSRSEAVEFLQSVCSLLRVGDYLLVGFDLKKDIKKLQAAYDDSAGLTALFNKNVLHRINAELGGDFEISKWYHHAYWNPYLGAMESWLVPTEDQRVKLKSFDDVFEFRAFEGIRVEQSFKYSLAQVTDIGREAGFNHAKSFVRDGFCNALFQKIDTLNEISEAEI